MDRPWLKFYPQGISTDVDLTPYPSLPAMIKTATDQFAEKDALVCLGVTMSYSRFEEEAEAFASYLQNVVGLRAGDRLAIMLPNVFEFPIAFYAAQKIGVICVSTNPLYTPREMLHQFADSGAKAVVMMDLFLNKLEEILERTNIRSIIRVGIADRLPVWKKVLIKAVLTLKKMIPKHNLHTIQFQEAVQLGRPNKVILANISHGDVALLQYTGGTTGVSKGAMLTHANIIANILQNREWAKNQVIDGQETVLTALPLYHIYALTVNFLSFVTMGQRMILLPRPIPIKKTVEAFKKYDITVLTGVNTLFNEMVRNPEFKKLRHGRLRCALAGGMALQSSVAEEWERTTGTPAIEGYGLTEASPVTHCNPLDGNHRLGTIGVPLPSTFAKVVDEDGREVAMGEVGELMIRGPQVMKGYWGKPEESQKVLRDGWLLTGDMASCDGEGFFKIIDRKKDMIIVSGFNVYPNEVEDVLSSHPKVREIAVIGVPDAKSGERVKAFVVLDDPAVTTQDLNAFARKNLAAYKCPSQWEFRDILPKSPVGKVLRRDLRDGAPGSSTAA